MTITAHIDTSTPTGRRILRELEAHKKVVKIDYPEPLDAEGLSVASLSAKESAKQAFDVLGKKYNCTFKNKYTECKSSKCALQQLHKRIFFV